MNWAAVGSTPFRRFKHFTHEGGISSPLIVQLARGDRGEPARRDRTAAGARHRHHGDGDGGDWREVSERVQGPRDSADGGRQSAAGARRPSAQPAATRSSGSTKGTAPCVRATGRSSRCIPRRGSCTTSPPIASSATTSRPSIPDIVKTALGRVGRVGQTDERGSLAGSGAASVGRRRTGPWRTAGRRRSQERRTNALRGVSL